MSVSPSRSNIPVNMAFEANSGLKSHQLELSLKSPVLSPVFTKGSGGDRLEIHGLRTEKASSSSRRGLFQGVMLMSVLVAGGFWLKRFWDRNWGPKKSTPPTTAAHTAKSSSSDLEASQVPEGTGSRQASNRLTVDAVANSHAPLPEPVSSLTDVDLKALEDASTASTGHSSSVVQHWLQGLEETPKPDLLSVLALADEPAHAASPLPQPQQDITEEAIEPATQAAPASQALSWVDVSRPQSITSTQASTREFLQFVLEDVDAADAATEAAVSHGKANPVRVETSPSVVV